MILFILVVHLKERYKGPYLASVVEEEPSKVDIKFKRVNSAPADDAKNMNHTIRQSAARALTETADDEHFRWSASDNECDVSEDDDEIQIDLENELNEIN